LAIESTQDLQNRALHPETATPIQHLLGHYAEITKFYFKALIATDTETDVHVDKFERLGKRQHRAQTTKVTRDMHFEVEEHSSKLSIEFLASSQCLLLS